MKNNQTPITPIKVGQLISLFLKNRDTYICFFSLLLQQTIVASSTIFIILLGESIAQHHVSILYLYLFIASLVLVYIPGIISHIFLERATFSAFKKYVYIFSETYQGCATLFNNSKYRKYQEPWLTNESFLVIDETSALFYDWVSSGFNSLLNIIIISFALEPLLSAAYLFSFLFLFLSIKISKNYLSASATEFQRNRNLMNQTLLSGWDNILIANIYNLNQWKNVFNHCWLLTTRSVIKYITLTSVSSSITMILTLLPIAGVTFWVFYENIENYAVLAALAVTLPRQIQIIQNTFDVFSHAIQWHGVKAKLTGLAQSLQKKSSSLPLEKKINWEKINVFYKDKKHKMSSIIYFLDFIKNIHQGRITIRAPNGAGKSVLLSLLKEKLSHKVFYLPTVSNLMFESMSNKIFSQGEKMIYLLEEIENHVCPLIILLDEWDANLDKENMKKISKLIDRIAEKNILVEVRHRTETPKVATN